MASAIRLADRAAKAEFDDYLRASGCTAAGHVPPCVVEAARAAFTAAGGTGRIIVRGHGNATHPVCWVEAKRVKARG